MNHQNNPFERSSQEQKESHYTEIDLTELRAGHWPGIKQPPWLFNEAWEVKHPEWRKAVDTINWTPNKKIKVGTGILKTNRQTWEIEIYALRDTRRGPEYYYFAAYPKERVDEE